MGSEKEVICSSLTGRWRQELGLEPDPEGPPHPRVFPSRFCFCFCLHLCVSGRVPLWPVPKQALGVSHL